MKNELVNVLLEKSNEAFLLAVEIYNKPTIKYRAESFAFFICNAWELLLKAKLISEQGEDAIYYPKKDNRTISLNECIKKVFTNENDPVRKNIEIVMEFRNTSTHFIIKEFEQLYINFFQACVLNYSQKLLDFFNIDISEKIDSGFMTLITHVENISDTDILGKYGKNIFLKYKNAKTNTDLILEGNRNEKLAINININAKLVKDETKAQFTFRFSKDAEDSVMVVKELKDINTQYPYNQNKAIAKINKILQKKHSLISTINGYQYQQLCKYFKLYDNLDFCYPVLVDKKPRKIFSQNAVDFIVNQIVNDKEIINKAIKGNKKNS